MRPIHRLSQRSITAGRRTGKQRRNTDGHFRNKLHVEELEHRLLLNGVTLITHGFNDNASGWVAAMANAVAADVASRDSCSVSDVAQLKLTVRL